MNGFGTDYAKNHVININLFEFLAPLSVIHEKIFGLFMLSCLIGIALFSTYWYNVEKSGLLQEVSCIDKNLLLLPERKAESIG